MFSLWRKISRGLRSKFTGSVIGLAIILLLVLYNSSDNDRPNKQPSHNLIAEPNVSSRVTPKRSTTNERSKQTNGTQINPYPFKFVMLSTPCTDEELVIIVHSAVQYHTRRMLMRQTWLNRLNLEQELVLKVKIVFVTGWTENEMILHRLDYEQEMYGDIIQSDFIDSYENNTHKAISFMRWVSSDDGCPNASLVLKVDDDALIHPTKITKLNATIHKALDTGKPDIYLGRLLTRLVNRRNTSKWYISYDVWPEELYPVWFQGLVYMITPHLAAKLPQIALDTKYMFTDDVYVGVLVSKVQEAHVMVEDMLGDHTEGPLKDFLGSFKYEGRIFYHVPSIEYFYRWYYLANKLISLNRQMQPKPNLDKKIRSISTSSPSLAFLILMFIIILLCVVRSRFIFAPSANNSSQRSNYW